MKIKLTLKKMQMLAAACLLSLGISAQVWAPWQDTPQGATAVSDKTVAALAEGNMLTLAYNEANIVKVKQFDGISWSNLPDVTMEPDSVAELIRFQDDLFLLTYEALHKLDGQNWQLIEHSGSGAFYDIEIYNNQLVFGGRYSVQIPPTTNMFFYDGVNVKQVVPPVFLDSISDFQVYNNDLYIASGGYTTTGGISGLAKYDGTNWTDAAQYVPLGKGFQTGLSVFEMKGKLYIADYWGVHEVRNDSIVPISPFVSPTFFYGYGNQSEVKVFNDSAYFGVRFANKNMPHGVQVFDGQTISLLPDSPTYVTCFAGYQNNILAFGPGVSSTINSTSSMIWAKSTTLSTIEVNRNVLIDIFPNPAKDELHIMNHEAEAIEFQLINSAGIVVEKVVAQPEVRTTIMVSTLSSGLYLLKSEFSTYKVIVK
jgi:hypothetical protein